MTDTTDAERVTFAHDPAKHRYEIRADDRLIGRLVYALPDDEHVDALHTEVDDAYEGQGLASRLVRFALDDVRAAGKRVIPHCPYVARWLTRHEEYADLVDQP